MLANRAVFPRAHRCAARPVGCRIPPGRALPQPIQSVRPGWQNQAMTTLLPAPTTPLVSTDVPLWFDRDPTPHPAVVLEAQRTRLFALATGDHPLPHELELRVLELTEQLEQLTRPSS